MHQEAKVLKGVKETRGLEASSAPAAGQPAPKSARITGSTVRLLTDSEASRRQVPPVGHFGQQAVLTGRASPSAEADVLHASRLQSAKEPLIFRPIRRSWPGGGK